MARAVFALKPKMEEDQLSFSGDGRIFPVEPDVLKVGARLHIVKLETDLFGTAVFTIRVGKIANIISEGNKTHITARFKKEKVYTKEEIINKMLEITRFKEEELKKTFEKAFSTNFSIEDLRRIAEYDDARFETPKLIEKWEDGIYLKIEDEYFKM